MSVLPNCFQSSPDSGITPLRRPLSRSQPLTTTGHTPTINLTPEHQHNVTDFFGRIATMQANIALSFNGDVNFVCDINGQTMRPPKRWPKGFLYDIEDHRIDDKLINIKRIKSKRTKGKRISSKIVYGNNVDSRRINRSRTNRSRADGKPMSSKKMSDSRVSGDQRSADQEVSEVEEMIPWEGQISTMQDESDPPTQAAADFATNTDRQTAILSKLTIPELIHRINWYWNPSNHATHQLDILIPAHLHPFATTLGLCTNRLNSAYSWDKDRLIELAIYAEEARYDGITACRFIVDATETRGASGWGRVEFTVGDVRSARVKYQGLMRNEREIRDLEFMRWLIDEEVRAVEVGRGRSGEADYGKENAERLYNVFEGPGADAFRKQRGIPWAKKRRGEDDGIEEDTVVPDDSQSWVLYRPDHDPRRAAKQDAGLSTPVDRIIDFTKDSFILPGTPSERGSARKSASLQRWVNDVLQSPGTAIRRRRGETERTGVDSLSPLLGRDRSRGGLGIVMEDDRTTIGDSDDVSTVRPPQWQQRYRSTVESVEGEAMDIDTPTPRQSRYFGLATSVESSPCPMSATPTKSRIPDVEAMADGDIAMKDEYSDDDDETVVFACPANRRLSFGGLVDVKRMPKEASFDGELGGKDLAFQMEERYASVSGTTVSDRSG